MTAAAEDACNEFSRFDAEMGSEIAPFHTVLLRSESAASSRIENLTASARAIAEAEHGSRRPEHAAVGHGCVSPVPHRRSDRHEHVDRKPS